MAKMFYTLEEASDRLGMDADAIKALAADGKLQQFRDRDKLMFKREQVDNLAQSDADSPGGSSLGIPLADPGPDDTDQIDLADEMSLSSTGGTDAISLADDSAETEAAGSSFAAKEDPREATGISVFDAGEVEDADPMAQTQVTQPNIDDEELALESVGSGSGLLDLTRESDDTSLGAELLDEIYPSGESAAPSSTGGDFGLESSVGSSGVFDGALSMETGASGPSGLENLTASDPGSVDAPMMGGEAIVVTQAEEFDPAGSAMGAGLLIGASIALIISLIVVVAAIAGSRSALTSALVSEGSANNVMFLCIGLLVISGVLAGVGMMLGKGSAR